MNTNHKDERHAKVMTPERTTVYGWVEQEGMKWLTATTRHPDIAPWRERIVGKYGEPRETYVCWGLGSFSDDDERLNQEIDITEEALGAWRAFEALRYVSGALTCKRTKYGSLWVGGDMEALWSGEEEVRRILDKDSVAIVLVYDTHAHLKTVRVYSE